MSVRKRTWTTSRGERKEAFIVDYVDQSGHRHIRTFPKKGQAANYAITVGAEVRDGTHTAESNSVTIAEAGRLWINTCEGNNLERASVNEYRRHVDMHIVPYIGSVKLARFSAPSARAFLDKLAEGTAPHGTEARQPMSAAMVRKVRGSLGALLADAQERGLVNRNVVRDLLARRRRGKERRSERRQRGKLKIGIDIPSPGEVSAVIEAAEGRARPLLLTAIFTGLRGSELRGLRWSDVDFKAGELHVRQRADRFHKIGRPKSEAGERTVPIPPKVLAVLATWKLACPKGKTGKDGDFVPSKLDLVFPTGDGTVESHANITKRVLGPAMVAAGVTTPVLDAEGRQLLDADRKPVVKPKYAGMHALRHFFASWCINRRADGGLELPAKLVQERLGHASIMMTLDVYGHLFPRGDDNSELAAAETAIFG